jgi:beta-phosphoglucomutase-like phosphatase (HAD superfamily)
VRNTVEIMMDKSTLRPYLDLLLSNQDVNKGKPDPEIYTTAIQRLGLTPQECLVVEDNVNGIKAATDAGAHVMVVQTVYDVHYTAITQAIAVANQAQTVGVAA